LSEANRDLKTTILLVTHDAYAASFTRRILFFKDGQILDELHRENKNRREFYDIIMGQVALLDENR
ncbi:MAG TPA: bacitracin ABC transporter ATP-binding protein, partial [Clostridiales bacterium]|nr:bacitracin ABC transporter ATP-binding protein [Clostridiales bacterium]